MSSLDITKTYPLDLELLEAKASEEVCACLAYVLADNLDVTTDQELIDIINHSYEDEMWHDYVIPSKTSDYSPPHCYDV